MAITVVELTAPGWLPELRVVGGCTQADLLTQLKPPIRLKNASFKYTLNSTVKQIISGTPLTILPPMNATESV